MKKLRIRKKNPPPPLFWQAGQENSFLLITIQNPNKSFTEGLGISFQLADN